MSNSNEEMKARLNLHAVLPVLEDLERLDRTFGGKGTGKARGTLVMEVEGRPDLASTIWFKGGGVEVVTDNWRKPSIKLLFPSPEAMNASFAGGTERPRIRGFMGLLLLPKFMKLSKLLGKSLQGDEAPGGVKSRAALLMKVVIGSMEILARHDPDVKTTIKELEGVMQFGIENDGPFHHLVFECGKVAMYGKKHSSPKSTILWADPETCVAVLSGKLDAMEALGQQKMKMEGDPGFAMQVGGIMGKVGEILQP